MFQCIRKTTEQRQTDTAKIMFSYKVAYCNAVGMRRKWQRPIFEQLDNLLTGKDKEGKQRFLTHLTTRLPAVP